VKIVCSICTVWCIRFFWLRVSDSWCIMSLCSLGNYAHCTAVCELLLFAFDRTEKKEVYTVVSFLPTEIVKQVTGHESDSCRKCCSKYQTFGGCSGENKGTYPSPPAPPRKETNNTKSYHSYDMMLNYDYKESTMVPIFFAHYAHWEEL